VLENRNFALMLAASLQTFYINKAFNIAEIEILKILGKSKLYENTTLMPLQLKFLKKMNCIDKLIISAPTSFGKTFLTMEHIKRNVEKEKMEKLLKEKNTDMRKINKTKV